MKRCSMVTGGMDIDVWKACVDEVQEQHVEEEVGEGTCCGGHSPYTPWRLMTASLLP